MGSARTPGRPRDAAATRTRILDAARVRFGLHGFRATTVKGVADDAGVSPNLITRYFGSKDGLFLAASRPAVAVDDVYSAGLDGFGDRLARSVVRRWTGQVAEDPLLVLLRAAGERREAAEELARFLDVHTTQRLQAYLSAQGLPDPRARDCADAIDALILGLTTRRRLLRDDLGDLEQLHRWLSRAIQRIVAD